MRGGKLRLLARIGSATLPLLEPGEHVLVSLYATDRSAQMWQLAFGWIGYLVSASQGGAHYMTVTDRRVLMLSGPLLNLRPRVLDFAVPRSIVSATRYRSGILADSLTITRVTGEASRLRVARFWRPEGRLAEQLLAPGLMSIPMPSPPRLS